MLRDKIIQLIAIRPCTVKTLNDMFKSPDAVREVLNQLYVDGMIQKTQLGLDVLISLTPEQIAKGAGKGKAGGGMALKLAPPTPIQELTAQTLKAKREAKEAALDALKKKAGIPTEKPEHMPHSLWEALTVPAVVKRGPGRPKKGQA